MTKMELVALQLAEANAFGATHTGDCELPGGTSPCTCGGSKLTMDRD
jgi:hypothetical protein